MTLVTVTLDLDDLTAIRRRCHDKRVAANAEFDRLRAEYDAQHHHGPWAALDRAMEKRTAAVEEAFRIAYRDTAWLIDAALAAAAERASS